MFVAMLYDVSIPKCYIIKLVEPPLSPLMYQFLKKKLLRLPYIIQEKAQQLLHVFLDLIT